MNWKYTHIVHSWRRSIALSLNAYAVLDVYYQNQTHPSTSRNGWTDVTFEEVGAFLGLSKSTVFELVTKAVADGLFEVNPDNKKLRRTTAKWCDNAYMENFEPKGVCSESERKSSESERKSSESEQTHYYKESISNKERDTHTHTHTHTQGRQLERLIESCQRFIDYLNADDMQQRRTVEYTAGWSDSEHGLMDEQVILFISYHSGNAAMMTMPMQYVNKFVSWLIRCKQFNKGKNANSNSTKVNASGSNSGQLFDSESARSILERIAQRRSGNG